MSLTPTRYTPADHLQRIAESVESDEGIYRMDELVPFLKLAAKQARVLDRLRAELTAGDVFTTGIPSMFGERFVKVLDRLLREEGVTP